MPIVNHTSSSAQHLLRPFWRGLSTLQSRHNDYSDTQAQRSQNEIYGAQNTTQVLLLRNARKKQVGDAGTDIDTTVMHALEGIITTHKVKIKCTQDRTQYDLTKLFLFYYSYLIIENGVPRGFITSVHFSAIIISTMRNFCGFPVAVKGTSSTNRTIAGTL